MTSKPIVIIMVALLVLAVPAGVLGISQTAQAQLGEDIANSVLDSVFGTNADDGTEEEDATETEEEAATESEDQSGDDNQDIDQTADQENDQSESATTDVSQSNDQSESNEVANDLHTGDNSATVAQSNSEDQDVAADADVSDSAANAASEADAEDDDHIKAKKKSYVSDFDTTSAGSQADAIISATAEATGIQGDQNNTADVDQDSSVHDVDLSNNIAFAEDTNEQIAVPITAQNQEAENEARQNAANLDLEEATNVFPYGFTSESTTTTTTTGGFCPPGLAMQGRC